VAHHVTFQYPDNKKPPDTDDIYVIGRCSDDVAECLVIRINGETQRPGGGTFHITWSLQNRIRPVHSNHVLKTNPIEYLENPIKIDVMPSLNR
jgi:hypothetical protein